MLSPGKGGSAPVYGHALGHATYERHRPEQTLLYRLIEKHYPALVEQLEFQGKSLPTHVHREFEAYLKCGRLEHGFLRVRCDKCHFERLVAFSCKKRGLCPSCGARRMAETAALVIPIPAVRSGATDLRWSAGIWWIARLKQNWSSGISGTGLA